MLFIDELFNFTSYTKISFNMSSVHDFVSELIGLHVCLKVLQFSFILLL